MGTRSGASCPGYPLVDDLDALDRHLVAGRVEGWAGPLGRPAIDEVPAQLLRAGLVEQDDRAVFALDFAVGGLFAPLVELGVCGDAPLERDVRVGVHAGQLAQSERLAALALIDRVLAQVHARALA